MTKLAARVIFFAVVIFILSFFFYTFRWWAIPFFVLSTLVIGAFSLVMAKAFDL